MDNKYTGEQLTFYNLFKQKKYTVEIPIIQRDYAQGRDTAVDVRQHFLDALYSYLINDKSVDLDFVYGTLLESQKTFIPLDGQQRLTTLFLLHWYLAVQEGMISQFREIMLQDSKSKFTYKTRTTSREFCDGLVSFDVKSIAKDDIVSKVIMNASWFFSSWERDPTITSMLVMLDAIHNKFHKTEAFGFYDKLVSSDHPAITFQFIELRKFGLTDSLYIKMNARGKPLTDFENFKAKFEQLLSARDKNKATFFAKQMDSDWTDLFWNYRNEDFLYDDAVMNFFRIISVNYYARKDVGSADLIANLKLLIGKDDPQNSSEKVKKVDFYKLEALGCFEDEGIDDIIQTLEFLKNGTLKVKMHLQNSEVVDERLLFEKVLNNDLNYTERIQFYALYKYLTYNQSSVGVEEWMRVIRNLSENTIYNEATEFAASIRAITELMPFSNIILSYLTGATNQVKSFAGVQVEEERIKALLIARSEQWKMDLYHAENHKYFRGQIGFLLKFSGVTSRYKNDVDTVTWSDAEDDVFREHFNCNVRKAFAIFKDDGLNDFPKYSFERALLTKGNYLLKKGRNHSFLVNKFDRDISWKRFLRDDTIGRDCLKILLNEVRLDTLVSDIQETINNFNENDWRYYFVKHPGLLSVCGTNKFIRWDHDKDILLLEKTQTNGTHREYYSYALSLQLKELGNQVLYMEANSIDDSKYIFQLNGKRIDIRYGFNNGKWNYKIEHNNDTNYFSNTTDVLEFLNQEGLIK